MKLPPEKAIFVFIKKHVIPTHAERISCLYNDYKDEDGFLYINYTGENTFGIQTKL
jgi:GABA(A) receptor-associated protein